jgi:hypothetical protein
MGDERLSGTALLPLVRRRRESEGAGDELGVDVCTVRSELREQALEELFVPFACFEGRHYLSVLPGFGLNLCGRNGR